MSSNEFSRQQQDAINRMREMNKKSTNPPPDNNRRPPPKPQPKQQNSQDGSRLELPFGNLFKDKDTALILGLLLILYGEKADKMLLLALVYILL
ncbi:MAG: hypothetical protein U0L88_10755 [Acutalibacteraceae bacterium]|nr:hypothetical protein [Acutalibacteraceae bacterium]